jgi:membrane protein DedA with SNARE-associated domain
MTFENIQNWIQSYGLIVLFFGNILDHSGIPLFILVAGGIVALDLQVFETVLFISFISVLVGDILFYFIGRYFDHDKFINFLGFRLAKSSVLKFEVNIINKPFIFILFGRLIAIVGKYVPFILGLKKYSINKFILIDVFGSFMYSSIFLIIGYYGISIFSNDIQLTQKLFILAGLILLFFLFRKTSLESIDTNFSVSKKGSFLRSVKTYNKEEKIRPTSNPPDMKSKRRK